MPSLVKRRLAFPAVCRIWHDAAARRAVRGGKSHGRDAHMPAGWAKFGRTAAWGVVLGLRPPSAPRPATIFFGRNLHAVIPGQAYRCAQLSHDQLLDAHPQNGIRTVVNLRGTSPDFDWYRDESRATFDADIGQEDITLSAYRLPSPDELRRLIDVFDHAEYPILFHCRQGVDRTGLAAAAAAALADRRHSGRGPTAARPAVRPRADRPDRRACSSAWTSTTTGCGGRAGPHSPDCAARMGRSWLLPGLPSRPAGTDRDAGSLAGRYAGGDPRSRHQHVAASRGICTRAPRPAYMSGSSSTAPIGSWSSSAGPASSRRPSRPEEAIDLTLALDAARPFPAHTLAARRSGGRQPLRLQPVRQPRRWSWRSHVGAAAP